MDFREYVRETVGRSGVGIEFGASYSPVVPKKSGFNVFVVDHTDEETLKEKYRGHPVDVSRIEPVDAIDDGGELTNLLKDGARFDYIVASHVFEHLPDPIKFLQRCERALKPDGKLFLMIPDRRFTFDYFRPLSSTGDLLRAYLDQRKTHDAGALFDHHSMSALRDGAYIWADANPGQFTISGTVQAGYAAAVAHSETYVDCHAWIFTPSSFRLILDDLRAAGLTRLGELEFYDSIGCEFFTVLSASAPPAQISRVERAKLILQESNEGSVTSTKLPQPATHPAIGMDESYEKRAPSAQKAIDTMMGSWVADFPAGMGLRAGDIPLSSAGRITWMIEQLGGLTGIDILELGPLEASHTGMLLDAGAASVLAIEANRLAFLKCLIAKEIRGLSKASFLLGDFTKFFEQDSRRWSLIVASGVLYHMEEPLTLLERMSERTDRLFLWTHMVDDVGMPEGDPRRAAITSVEERVWRGRKVRHYLRPYGNKSDPKFCGGVTVTPAWLNRVDLLEALKILGFDDIRIANDDATGVAGPAFSILAQRSSPS